ncbi:MetQ/NlpA family ABC transporter substrate-binding protein [Methylobacterium sp. WL64]|uniref:MetQ/NlpA family ABC transporter substrate-binding protein n=1 Tax=Methylobacterium sp. WL64 TaxID=2603894 RepID=UPI001FED74F6|nr:MetQ/NlpA family ABC transporter substrate-binding protein [Methylobacterium sp. WL64]
MQNIAKNRRDLRFVDVTPAQLPRSRVDVDVAVINGNYTLDSGQVPARAGTRRGQFVRERPRVDAGFGAGRAHPAPRCPANIRGRRRFQQRALSRLGHSRPTRLTVAHIRPQVFQVGHHATSKAGVIDPAKVVDVGLQLSKLLRTSDFVEILILIRVSIYLIKLCSIEYSVIKMS